MLIQTKNFVRKHTLKSCHTLIEDVHEMKKTNFFSRLFPELTKIGLTITEQYFYNDFSFYLLRFYHTGNAFRMPTTAGHFRDQ